MIDTNHWGYQQVLREAIQYRILRRALEAAKRPGEEWADTPPTPQCLLWVHKIGAAAAH